MRRVHRALVVATTTTLVVVAAPAGTGATTVPGDGHRIALQERLDDIVDAGAVGALAEVRDEDGVWRSTSGTAEEDRIQPVPVNGRFRAGSITKTFLATVILQLVDEQRVSLDDTVEEWLPGVVPDGDGITVRHLLNHTSGLYDFVRTLPFPPRQAFFDNRWRTWTAAELVQRAVANPPTFEPPGRAFAYSNTGYALLGQILEEATGRPYGVEIERRIIRPLGLHATSMPGTDPRIHGPHPHGYVPRTEERDLLEYTQMNPSMQGAGGEMISTTRDLNLFFDALLGGRLIPDRLLDQMRTAGIQDGRKYGLGLAWRDTACGIRVYGNDGDALTYQSWSFTSEDRRRQATVALTPDFAGDPDRAVDAFLDEAFCG